MSTALYPGSFDPFHVGHLDVVEQAVTLFGNVVVAVMHNPDKPSGVLTTTERVEVAGLAVDAAKSVSALCIVKGLRTPGDFEIEQQMAHTNFAVAGVRTVYVPCDPAFSYVSSRYIRDIAMHGGDVSALVPKTVQQVLKTHFSSRGK